MKTERELLEEIHARLKVVLAIASFSAGALITWIIYH